MRRVILVTLLAMGLPTAALANSIDFTTGHPFASGTFSGSLTTSLNVSVTGSMNTISISTGTLTAVAPGLYTFSNGNVTVSSGGTTLFTDTFNGSGAVTSSGNVIGIEDSLAPFTFDGMSIISGIANLSVTLSGNAVTDGTGSAVLNTATTVPEPGTLGLLGTGLMGLAEMVRRKFKLPT